MIKITMKMTRTVDQSVDDYKMTSSSHLFLRPSFHSTLDVAPGALKDIYGKKLKDDHNNITMRVEEKKSINTL